MMCEVISHCGFDLNFSEHAKYFLLYLLALYKSLLKRAFLFLIMHTYVYVHMSVDAHRYQISWSWELQEIMSYRVTVRK